VRTRVCVCVRKRPLLEWRHIKKKRKEKFSKRERERESERVRKKDYDKVSSARLIPDTNSHAHARNLYYYYYYYYYYYISAHTKTYPCNRPPSIHTLIVAHLHINTHAHTSTPTPHKKLYRSPPRRVDRSQRRVLDILRPWRVRGTT